METGNSMFGDYGENILESYMNSSSDDNLLSQANNQQGTPGDILQQSLEAAKIIDHDNESNDLFEDLGFTFTNNQYTNNTSSDSYQFQSQSASSDVYLNQHIQPSNAGSPFDTTQFLNVATTNVNTANVQEQSSPQSRKVSFETYQSVTVANTVQLPSQQNATLISHNPVTELPKQPSQQTGLVLQNQVTPNKVVVQPNQLRQLQVQLSTASPLGRQINSNQLTSTNSLYQNAQYFVSGQQSTATSTNSPYIVQSNSVSVCGSTFSRLVTQPVSVATVVTVNAQPNQIMVSNVQPITTNTVVDNLTQQRTVVLNSNTLQQQKVISNREEQTNKLALILQNKAAQQSATGKAGILRVGNQNINISDPAVAKALASKILEQRLKQQAQNQSSIASSVVLPSSATVNLNQNQTVLNATGFQGKSVVVNTVPRQQTQPQVKAEYVLTSLPQNTMQNTLVHQNRRNAASPQATIIRTVAVTKSNTPVIQLSVTKSSSPVPINRIQIASVNIPLTTNQVVANSNMLTIQTTRSSTPVQLQSNTNGITNQAHKIQTSKIAIGNMQPASATGTTPATTSNTIIQQLGTTLKLNLTPQQTSNLSREQLQRLLIQHQAAVRARKVTTPVSTAPAPVQSSQPTTLTSLLQPKTTQASQNVDNAQAKTSRVVTFRVEPNLTWQQIEQVQNIISQKTQFSKMGPLTKEQKQILAAFRAQLRAMEAPIQQYYMRNPQLFLQKVYQHLQTGKPYIFQAKVEQNSVAKGSGSTTAKFHHPTISLTPDSQKSKLQTIRVERVVTPTPPAQQRKPLKRPNANDSTSVESPIAVYPPTKRPSLIMEQLQKHREIAVSPNTETPFNTIRDACRQLLPYHVLNMPQISDNFFEESEPLFDDISEVSITKSRKMFKKYHLLCLKEATREACSADGVMLERSFLQHERASFVELKSKLKENPLAIKNFIKPEVTASNSELVSYLQAEQSKQQETLVKPNNVINHFNLRKISQQSSDSYAHSEYSSPGYPGSAKSSYIPFDNEQSRYITDQADEQSDILLQEAVESILS